MRAKTVSILAMFILSIVAAVGVLAITFGEPDGGAHPYVGLMYLETPSGIYRCSGVLLSPTLFLTAGHCTEEGGVSNMRTWVTFDEEVVIPDDVLMLPDDEFGDWLDTQPQFIRGMAIPHPQYEDYAEFPATYDLGVVVLYEQVDLPAYAALPSLGFLEGFTKGQGRRGNRFTAVGYGLQGFINPFFGAEQARYKGDVRLVELNSTYNAGMSAKFTNNPGGGNGRGGTCFGDSGGPVFYDDTNVVAAVVSFGITPCIGVDYQFRVDTDIAQDFIAGVWP